MAIVNMPALSPTMTEGKLAKWLVNEGDAVTSGDVIAEIETDKALMEVEALDDGIMASILVPEGSEAVAVGTPIAEILGEGENSALSAAPQKKEAPIAEE
ncbi:MAG: biotin/lipoyl-containing protein, partial [Candidatus Puniceispirillales bacterium]